MCDGFAIALNVMYFDFDATIAPGMHAATTHFEDVRMKAWKKEDKAGAYTRPLFSST